MAAGCAGSSSAPDELDTAFDLAAWRVVRTAGFTGYTNAPDGVALRSLRRVDRFVHVANQLLFGKPFAPDRPVELVLFRETQQYQRFFDEGTQTLGHAGRRGGTSMLALGVDAIGGSSAVLHHEFVHILLIEGTEIDVPSWLHEGLAEFFATATLRHDVLTLGGVPMHRQQALRRAPPLALDHVLSLHHVGYRGRASVDRQYADAWAFVHFVVLGRPGPAQRGTQTLEGLERRLASLLDLARRQRSGESLATAIEAVLGEPMDRVSRDYEEHRNAVARAEVQNLWHFVIPEESRPLAFEALSVQAAARELASYGETIAPDEPLVASLWDRALREDPTEPRAIEGRIRAAAAVGEFARAHALWGRLSDAERRSPRAAWTAGVLAHAEFASRPARDRADRLASLEEARRHYRRALEAEPDRVRVLAALGNTYVLDEDGDPSEGIAPLERALAISPRDPEVRLDIAILLRREGADAEAEAHLQYVIETYPDSAFAKRAEALSEE